MRGSDHLDKEASFGMLLYLVHVGAKQYTS